MRRPAESDLDRRPARRAAPVTALAVVGAALVWALPAVAQAAFTASAVSSGPTVSSGVLGPASAPAAALTCTLGIASRATITWTASTNTRASYVVTASAVGAGTVSPASQTVSGTSASVTFGGLATGVNITVKAVIGGWSSTTVAASQSC